MPPMLGAALNLARLSGFIIPKKDLVNAIHTTRSPPPADDCAHTTTLKLGLMP